MAVSQLRWRQYWEYLDDIGIKKGTPVRELLGRDVFHDSAISIDVKRLPHGLLILSMDNIVALDAIMSMRKGGQARETKVPSRSVVSTNVVMSGVRQFDIHLYRNYSNFIYHSADLEAIEKEFRLTINIREGNETPGRLRILCNRIEIQDIAPKLRPYLRRGVTPFEILQYKIPRKKLTKADG
jgi:hypothetical protein